MVYVIGKFALDGKRTGSGHKLTEEYLENLHCVVIDKIETLESPSRTPQLKMGTGMTHKNFILL